MMPFALPAATDPSDLLDGALVRTRHLAAVLAVIAGAGRDAFEALDDQSREALLFGAWREAEDAAALVQAFHDRRPGIR